MHTTSRVSASKMYRCSVDIGCVQELRIHDLWYSVDLWRLACAFIVLVARFEKTFLPKSVQRKSFEQWKILSQFINIIIFYWRILKCINQLGAMEWRSGFKWNFEHYEIQYSKAFIPHVVENGRERRKFSLFCYSIMSMSTLKLLSGKRFLFVLLCNLFPRGIDNCFLRCSKFSNVCAEIITHKNSKEWMRRNAIRIRESRIC